MEFKKLKDSLSKELLLSKVSQEDIFSFFGIIVSDKKVKNPLRIDKNATCYFYKSSKNNVVYFVDHASNIHWDCFNYVQELHTNCNFYDCLCIIAKKFNIDASYIDSPLTSKIKYKQELNEGVTRDCIKTTITFNYQKFTNLDLLYWKDYNINENILNYFKVFSVVSFYINNAPTPSYLYRINNPCYAYYFTKDNIKLYFPLRTSNKWLNNSDVSIIQGYDQLPELGETLIITKSLKDVMCLYSIGIPAISSQSESSFPSNKIKELKKRFKDIYIMYDNDDTGIKMSDKFSKEFNIKQIFTPKNNCKDISDYTKKYGIKEAEIYINSNLN